MKKKLIIPLLFLLFAGLACNISQNLKELGDQTPTPDAILYKDDFEDPSTGWASNTDADGLTDYDDGFYRIRVDTVGVDGNGMDMWARPNKVFDGDVVVEVDAIKVDGPNENDMGVICRYSKTADAYNFYYFVITSDGFAAIAKMKDSQSTFISGKEMNVSSAVKIFGTNHIRAECVGKNLVLYVNGIKAASAVDDEFTGGDVGLIAGTFSKPGVDIHFDNFVVSKP